jgi:hypothetical protein
VTVPPIPPHPVPGTAPSRTGSLVLALFALPFAAVGVWAGVSFVSHWQSEGWTESTVLRAIFAATFGGAGFGLWALIPWLRRRQRAEHALRLRAPEEPWMWRPEWASGRIPCRGRAGVVFVWAFAGFWNLVSAPLAWKIPEEWARGNRAAAIGLLFPAVGLGLLVWAVRATWRWRRFGESHFVPSTRPGVVGGRLAGQVELSRRLQPQRGFEARLACVHVRVTGSGKNRSRHEDVLWEDLRTVPSDGLAMGPRGTSVPVAFAIPRRLEPTSPEAGDSTIEWRLDLSAGLPGVDYFARFEVPVFVTADSSDDVTDEDARR